MRIRWERRRSRWLRWEDHHWKNRCFIRYRFGSVRGNTGGWKQVNQIQTMTYYTLGRWIVEEQQNGSNRAEYGARVIERLSEALTAEFGRGFSREHLKNARKFYQVYQGRISQTVFTQFEKNPFFELSWPHYLIYNRLLRCFVLI